MKLASSLRLPCRQSNVGRVMRLSQRESNLKSPALSILLLSGDVPLIRVETLRKLIEHHRATAAACTILGVRLENPTGYGRIIRDEQGGFEKIVEQKDATDEERQVREINSGIYCFESEDLFEALKRVEPKNQQGEYYLTDVAEILLSMAARLRSLRTPTRVNSPESTRARNWRSLRICCAATPFAG